MRTLFSKFSAVGGFEGWMIAKLNFKRLLAERGRVSKENSEAVILRQRARYAIFQAEDTDWQIQMHLIKPKEQNKDTATKEEQKRFPEEELYCGKEIARWQIAKKEILEFVASVKDLNSIHRTEHAVVPGFLFVERLWKEKKVSEHIKGWKEFEVVFSSPAYEEEMITLLQEEKTGNIFAVTRRETEPILLWECRIL